MNFIEDIDQRFDVENLSQEQLDGLREALHMKSSKISEQITRDGELPRDVSILLYQRARHGQVENYKELLTDVKELKAQYRS